MKAFPFLHHPGEEERLARPIVHVLSGFLGAGKTTFLREWLEFLHGRERFTGVIQNEFGEVDLDSLVLKGTTRIEAIDEGCVCCTLADSLRPGLERLMAATPAEQFVIETTGNTPENYYIGSLELDGKPLQSVQLPFAEVVGGGTLRVNLAAEPNTRLNK